MLAASRHLTEIVQRHNRTCNAMIIFVDVEKYSTRRTLNQIEVIDALTSDMQAAIDVVARKHLAYCQNNDLNFKSDVIRIPTGDGAAVVFTFDGLPSVHLDFAFALLELAARRRSTAPCDPFDTKGWCNCHSYYNLRVGVAEGKAIIFEDVNGNYNVAGGTINMAARVMGLCDRNQIMFTADAYKQIVDMSDDPTFVDCFVEFHDVEIKHKEKIIVYQYVGRSDDFVNDQPPEDLAFKRRIEAARVAMEKTGLFPQWNIDNIDRSTVVDFVEQFTHQLTGAAGAVPPPQIQPHALPMRRRDEDQK